MVREEQVSSPLAEPLGALDSEAWSALVEDVATILAEHRSDDGISFPMHSQIVTRR